MVINLSSHRGTCKGHDKIDIFVQIFFLFLIRKSHKFSSFMLLKLPYLAWNQNYKHKTQINRVCGMAR